jgi:hypothetical protein
MPLRRYIARKNVRRVMILLSACIATLALLFGYLLVQSEALEQRFHNIHPDNTEALLLEIVGAPTSIRGCDEGVYRIPADAGAGTRRCVRVYWYSTYIFTDGWLVPIDDTGRVIQIRRVALP